MRGLLRSVLLVSLAIAPARDGNAADAAHPEPQPRSYLALPGGGTLDRHPYVWERRMGAKHLVVLGTRHLRDPRAPMFGRLEAALKRARPQLILHESQAPEALRTLSREQAVAVGADLGFTVHFAHQHRIPVRSADAPVRAEIRALLARHDAEAVFVFLVAQRLIGSVRDPDMAAVRAEYPAFYADYLAANGLPERAEWARWDGFLRAYRRVTGQPFPAAAWRPELISPLRRDGRLNALARSSMEIRDQYLLAAIERALREHDRVAVVFGSWHVLALEPVLERVLPH